MKQEFLPKSEYDISDLLNIMSILRSAEGCPWDREQDHHSLRNHLIEETYEAVEAIDREDMALLREELGDVLLQIVFHCELEAEKGGFTFREVCDGICRKMIFRHPHVFGEGSLAADETAGDRWDKMKQREKHYASAAEYLRQVSPALPALMRAEKLMARAEKRGLSFSEEELMSAAMASLTALHEKKDMPREQRRALWGELLLSVCAAAAGQDISAEEALERKNSEFITQFSTMEKLAMERYGGLQACDAGALKILWPEAENKNLSEE